MQPEYLNIQPLLNVIHVEGEINDRSCRDPFIILQWFHLSTSRNLFVGLLGAEPTLNVKTLPKGFPQLTSPAAGNLVGLTGRSVW